MSLVIDDNRVCKCGAYIDGAYRWCANGHPQPGPEMIVMITGESVTIKDQVTNQELHWIKDEWIEDPDVTLSIANAVFLATTNPIRLRETVMQRVPHAD